MQNIRNLKDPPSYGALMMIMLLLLWLSPVAIAAASKVTCTEHDTKITCDCKHVDQAMIMPQLQGSVYQVEVRNCRDLNVESNTLDATEGLRKIRFQQIDKLQLQKNALSVSRYKALIVEFENVNLERIDSHAISGHIEEISFVGGRIEQMQPFGFTTTKDSAILLKLDGVQVQRIESQAFKKFAVEKMIIANCIFEANLPTRAFYELEVSDELSIRNNIFQEVHSHAFSFKLISKMSISQNRFISVDGEWLEGHIRDSVTLRDNWFGATSDIAFRSLTVHRDYHLSERLELRFHNNTVHSLLASGSSVAGVHGIGMEVPPQPLRFDERFALSIKQLRYENSWSCEQLDMNLQPPMPRADFFRQHSEQLLFRRTSNAEEQQSGRLDEQQPQYEPLRQLIIEECQKTSYTAYIVVGSLLLALILILLLLLLWWRLAQRRKRRKLDVVQPEPRTYKETQIVYQIENAGLLKTDL